jgi:glycosyltransferase involved in cell wall biosynthesis
MRDAPLVVCFPFVGDELGGSHLSAIRLIERLDPKLVTALVALHFTSGPVAAYLADRGVPFVAAPGSGFPQRDLATGFGQSVGAKLRMMSYLLRSTLPTSRFLRRNEVDFVHTNDGRIHMSWALPARLAGARHIWHHRGDPDALGVNFIAPLVATHLITVSHFAKPRRPIVDVSRKLSVVRSPFDPPTRQVGRKKARAMLIETLGCSSEMRFLGYFGLLIDRKRPIGFVEAVAAFAKRHPEVPVMGLLFGVPGKEAPELDRLVLQRAKELGVADQIRLMGFRNPVEPWMQAMDALLVPAVREPFGRTLIEAMLLETPVIATDDGGNREAIEHGITGLLVPPDRPECFVEPIHSILTNEELRNRIVAAAADQASLLFGTDTHVRDVAAIYQRIQRPTRQPADRQESAREMAL